MVHFHRPNPARQFCCNSRTIFLHHTSLPILLIPPHHSSSTTTPLFPKSIHPFLHKPNPPPTIIIYPPISLLNSFSPPLNMFSLTIILNPSPIQFPSPTLHLMLILSILTTPIPSAVFPKCSFHSLMGITQNSGYLGPNPTLRCILCTPLFGSALLRIT